jgi:hypothetical protein
MNRAVTITNVGAVGLVVTAMTATAGFEAASAQPLPITLGPRQSELAGVRFTPRLAGLTYGTILLYSSAEDSPAAVKVWGFGVSDQRVPDPPSRPRTAGRPRR